MSKATAAVQPLPTTPTPPATAGAVVSEAIRPLSAAPVTVPGILANE